MFIQGQVDSSQMRLVSPKGIYDMYAQVRTESEQATNFDPKAVLLNLVSFFGVISAALGFSNLLPIPAVDGGRIFFMIPELLFNKRVPAKFENAVNTIGFTVILAIMALVFIQDIINPVVLPR
jgi:regulator of sigma E protease